MLTVPMEFELTTRIAASPSHVWDLLADIESWPEWTGSVKSVRVDRSTPFGPGAVVTLRQPGMPALEWTVTDWRPGSAFTWEAASAGIVTEASHRIKKRGPNSCTVTLRVTQTGPLAAAVSLLGSRRTKRLVTLEAEGLKARAEQT